MKNLIGIQITITHGNLEVLLFLKLTIPAILKAHLGVTSNQDQPDMLTCFSVWQPALNVSDLS